ncbi:MAG: homocysteine S-methyltransferase family protein, partial [Lachnospiraceae bacterium]|nr:homocysteine S-methyltransferase family protein [Lachnospiraceae bacterium]
MSAFDQLKMKKAHLVMDGPMGTELERRGYDVNDALWSAKFLKENPDAIRQIHYDYLRAGADMITCASYQASVSGFTENGYSEEEAEALIVKSLELAKEARDDWWEKEGKNSGRPYPLIAGDIGPYGAYLADG